MKFLYGYFNQDTGQSEVAIADKYGKYIGYAKLHPDDKQHASKYAGCVIAERRAYIKALQRKKRHQKIQLQMIINLAKDIALNCSTESYSEVNKRFNLEIKKHQKEIKKIDENIEKIKDNINKRIKIRNNLINNNKNYLAQNP